MSKYIELDSMIVQSIRNGRDRFFVLCCGPTGRLADTLAGSDGWGRRSGDRVIDRRLQALRKRGQIRFSGGRWHYVPPLDGPRGPGGGTPGAGAAA